MKLIKLDNTGKEIPYKFLTQNELNIYIETCRNIWGAVPCDVDWAVNTKIFKNEMAKQRKPERDYYSSPIQS